MEDQILVHLLFQTSLVDKLICLLSQKASVTFKNQSKAEYSYHTFLVELAQMIANMKDKNEAVKECLDDNPEWDKFYTETLKVEIERRKGTLYDDPRFPKADLEEATFISKLVGNFKRQKPRFNDPDVAEEAKFNNEKTEKSGYEDESSRIKQEDVDRLI